MTPGSRIKNSQPPTKSRKPHRNQAPSQDITDHQPRARYPNTDPKKRPVTGTHTRHGRHTTRKINYPALYMKQNIPRSTCTPRSRGLLNGTRSSPNLTTLEPSPRSLYLPQPKYISTYSSDSTSTRVILKVSKSKCTRSM